MKARQFLVLPPLAGLLLLAVPGTAHAASYTSAGQKCTKVGTAGNDWLEGTSKRDVICGLGGSDMILGLGGDDLLDGGTGNDWLYGDAGADRLLGGGGNDHLNGGDGTDTLVGGAGADTMNGDRGGDTVSYAERTAAVTADLDGRADDGVKGEGDLIATSVEGIKGGKGNDVLTGSAGPNGLDGGAGSDTLYGLGGNDYLEGGYFAGDNKLYGGAGDDNLSGGLGKDLIRGEAGADSLWGSSADDDLGGGDGNDVLYGDVGNDRVDGGAGDDEMRGDDGTDRLTGGPGEDDLDGGAGADHVDGGAGGNWCILDATDTTSVACPVDSAAPTAGEPSFSPAAVDVTDAPAVVTVRARVRDDAAGTDYVRFKVGNQTVWAGKVSGTRVDGVYEAKVQIPRYVEPGTLGLTVDAHDRLYKDDLVTLAGATLTVANALPDLAQATADGIALSTPAVDVRSAAASVTVDAHLTDDASGVRWAVAKLYAPDGAGGWRVAGSATLGRVSGSTRDGRWTGVLTIPQGEPSGDWTVRVSVTDQLHTYSPAQVPGPTLAVLGPPAT